MMIEKKSALCWAADDGDDDALKRLMDDMGGLGAIENVLYFDLMAF